MGCVFWVQLRVFLIDLHFCMGFNIFRGNEFIKMSEMDS